MYPDLPLSFLDLCMLSNAFTCLLYTKGDRRTLVYDRIFPSHRLLLTKQFPLNLAVVFVKLHYVSSDFVDKMVSGRSPSSVCFTIPIHGSSAGIYFCMCIYFLTPSHSILVRLLYILSCRLFSHFSYIFHPSDCSIPHLFTILSPSSSPVRSANPPIFTLFLHLPPI